MPKRVCDHLTEEELNKILDAALVNDRDYLILRVAARTGIRIGQLYGIYQRECDEWIHGIQKKDIDFRKKRLSVYYLRQQKYVRKKLPVDGTTINLLKKYTSKMDSEDYVFNSCSYRQLQRIPKKYAKLAGITKNVSFHSFRDFFIRDLRRNGIDPFIIKRLAGHSDMRSTMIYMEDVTAEDVEKTYHAIFT